MKSLYAYTLFGLLALLPLAASAEDLPSPYFSEINWAGSEASTADEWIEIYNPVDTPADLSHYVIAGAATGGDALEIAEGTIVDGLSTLLISNYPLEDERTTLQVEPDLVTSSLSLPNRDLELMLITPDGLVIDEYIDSGAPEFGSNDPYASMIRDPETMEWMTAEVTRHLPEGQFGTPSFFTIPAPLFEEMPADLPEDIDPVEAIPEEEQDPLEVAEDVLDEIETVDEVEESEADLIDDEVVEEKMSSDPMEELIEDDPEEEILDDEVMEVLVEDVAEELDDMVDEVNPIEIAEDAVEEIESIEAVEEREPDQIEKLIHEPIDETVRYGDVIITEIMPNPLDGDEWAELFNTTDRLINLSSWYFEDESGRAILIEEIELRPGNYTVIELGASYLNNGGDSLALYTDDSLKVDEMRFGDAVAAPEKGMTLGHDGESWRATKESTPGEANLFTELIIETYEEEPTDTKEKASVEASAEEIVIAHQPEENPSSEPEEIPQADGSSDIIEKTVKIVAIAEEPKATEEKKTSPAPKSIALLDVKTGRVTALPGLFGSQLMYIEGTAIYSYYADWPDVNIGDLIRVSGEETESRGEKRIKISAPSDIVILESGSIEGTAVNTAQIQSLQPGELVTIEANIEGINGKELLLGDEYGTVRVLAHDNTGIKWNDAASTYMRITGIIREIHGEHSLHPRSVEDIQHLNIELPRVDTDETETNEAIISTVQTSKTGLIGAIVFGASMLALIILYIAHAKSKQNLNS